MGFATEILQREIIDLLRTGADTLGEHEFVIGGTEGNEIRRLQADDWTAETLPTEGQHAAVYDADEATLVLVPLPLGVPEPPETGIYQLISTNGVLSWALVV